MNRSAVVNRRDFLRGSTGAALASPLLNASVPPAQAPVDSGKHRNIVFVLTDDQRYDALGFVKAQPFLETPNMDRLAKEGAYCKNAFVTTSLCSPSRASMLTGKYAFQHRIVDNNTPTPPNTTVFPFGLGGGGCSWRSWPGPGPRRRSGKKNGSKEGSLLPGKMLASRFTWK